MCGFNIYICYLTPNFVMWMHYTVNRALPEDFSRSFLCACISVPTFSVLVNSNRVMKLYIIALFYAEDALLIDVPCNQCQFIACY